MTYLQILNTIKDTALAQPNVNSVVREFLDLNREDAKYSAVVIQDRDGTRDRIVENDYITYTWHLGYVDRLTYDESNRDDIISTGINVINNIVNTIRNTWFPELEVSVVDRINTFDQRFTAQCAGVYVVLAVNAQVSDCVDSESTDLYDTYDAKITANGVYHFVPTGRPVDEINITVDVAGKEEVSLIDTVTLNGTHTYVPAEGTVYNDVELNVDVHPTERLVQTYTTNGVKTITGEFNGGEITVDVDTDTVWGEITGTITDQTDLIDYVTGKENGIKTWVESQSYINQIKTVNNQSLIGEGNIEISGMTPAQEAAIEPLMNPDEGVLNTYVIESEGILKKSQNPDFGTSDWWRYLYNVDGDIYCKTDSRLFIYNPETLSFDFLFYLSQYDNAPLWKDNSGRLYIGVNNQIDIENKTVTSVDLGGEYQYYGNSDNIYKGQYGIYILAYGNAYKFNEETQKFEVWDGTYTTDYQGSFNYYGNVKEYDGHIIIVEYGSFYELIETEDSITITSTDPYFNTTLPYGYSFDSYNFYKVGDNYYYFVNDSKFKLVNNEWVSFAEDFYYYNNWDIQLVSSDGLFILRDDNQQVTGFTLFNPGTSDYKKTLWDKISNIAVDLTSQQTIYGNKYFKGGAQIDSLQASNIYDYNNGVRISTLNASIVLPKRGNIELNCDYLLKNGVLIPTIDDIIANKTVTYPGKLMNEVTTASPRTPVYDKVWTTPSGRLFSGNYEWDFSTSTWIERSFNVDIDGTKSRIFTTSFGLTYLAPVNYGQIYVWNNSNTNWDLFYENSSDSGLNADTSFYWVYGGDLYYGNNLKFDPNNLEWISGEYCTNSSNQYSMCTIGNDVYVRNGNGEIMKYNPSTKTFDRVAQNQYFYSGYMFKYNNDLYVNENEYIYKYNTSTDEFDTVDNIGVFTDQSYYNIYFEFDGKLYTVKDEKIGYLYELSLSEPEVPATNGEYVLTGTRVGDSVTYSWETAPDLSSYATQSWATSQFLEESKVWTGTQIQWDALTQAQKESYTIALITE